MNATLGRGEILLAVLAATLVVGLVHLTPPSFLEGVDYLKLHLLNRLYTAERLHAGSLPLWNPYAGLGRPFLADIETGVFYPPNLVYLLLAPGAALVLLTLAHHVLAISGLLKLTRYLGAEGWTGWLAAFGFVAGAPLVARLQAGQGPYSHAACYVPIAFLLAARLQDRFSPWRLGWLAVVLALQLLCGHPQIAWLTWLGLGSFVFGRALPPARVERGQFAAQLAALAGALLLAFGLSGPMLLPFFELVSQANRSQPTLSFAAAGSLEPWQWLSLVVPNGERRVFYWESNLYVGLVPVLAGLAGLSRWRDCNVRGLAMTAVVGGLTAAGDSTPVFPLLYLFVPGLSTFHIHSRASFLVTFALLVAAASFLSGAGSRWGRIVGLALASAGAALGMLMWRALAPVGVALDTPPWTRLALLGCAAALVASVALARRARWRSAAVWVLAAFAVLDLAPTLGPMKRAWAWPVPVPGELELSRRLEAAGLLAVGSAPPRVLAPPWFMRENSGLAQKYASATAYVALYLDRVWVYLHQVLDVPIPADLNTYPSRLIFNSGPFPYDSMNLVAGWDPASRRVALRRDADPRAYLVGGALVLRDWRQALLLIKSGHDVHRLALLEEPLGLPGSAASVPGQAVITAFAPERVVIATDSRGPALLVLAEAWYPGWEATVDGAPAPCVPANVWMRGVPVPAGRHQVVMSFRSRWLTLGATLSLASLVVLAALVRASGRRDVDASVDAPA